MGVPPLGSGAVIFRFIPKLSMKVLLKLFVCTPFLFSVGNFAPSLSDMKVMNVTLKKKKGKQYHLQVTPFNTTEFVSVEPGT